MTKRAKIALWCLSHLSVMALGLLVGIAVEHRYGKQALEHLLGGAPALQGLYLQYVEVQRERGGYEQYRDALLDFGPVRQLAQVNPLLRVPFGGRTYHLDRMLNYTRLSRLESEQGTAAEAERYLALAVEECAESGLDECTRETPVEFLDLLGQLRRDIARTRIRRDKEADENIWTGPKKMWFPPR